jgi:hypothetical protein
MDSLTSHHIDRLKKRLHNSRLLTSSNIEKITEKLSDFEAKAESLNDEEFCQGISNLFQEISSLEPLKKICQEHRDTYTHLARLGKESEKYLSQNMEDLKTHQSEKLDKKALDRILGSYLLSQGLFSQALMLSDEINLSEYEIYEVISHIRADDLDSALKSCEKLRSSGKEVMFHLHKLKFMKLIKSGDLSQAVSYARDYLGAYSERHLDEIKHLMCACIYINEPQNSECAELFSDDFPGTVIHDILKEFSKYSDMPTFKEIENLIKAGQQAVPQIFPLAQISSKIWTNPLPTEIKLSQDLRFHSTFVCPITKEVATPSNPPMMLPCGHLIAQGTMDRLIAGTVRLKLKCPTCPTEATEKETKQVFI